MMLDFQTANIKNSSLISGWYPMSLKEGIDFIFFA